MFDAIQAGDQYGPVFTNRYILGEVATSLCLLREIKSGRVYLVSDLTNEYDDSSKGGRGGEIAP